MKAYILRRLLGLPFLVLGVSLVTFLLLHLTPGSPIQTLRFSNPNMTQQDVQNIDAMLGLNRPLPLQYLSWLNQLVHGNLGISMTDYRPVWSSIEQRLPNTLLLTGTVLVIGTLIGIPLGILSALRHNSRVDYAATLGSTMGLAMPSFWLGLLLIILFSVQFKQWGLPSLPTEGTMTVPGGGGFVDRVEHLVMPAATLSLAEISGSIKFFRYLMLEVLHEDYVVTARAKGLSARVVILRHAFRNAILPWMANIGLTLPSLFGGAVVVEVVFSWPGIGAFAVSAATGKDYTVIMGLTFFVAVLTIIGNLIADLLAAAVDPRIQLR